MRLRVEESIPWQRLPVWAKFMFILFGGIAALSFLVLIMAGGPIGEMVEAGRYFIRQKSGRYIEVTEPFYYAARWSSRIFAASIVAFFGLHECLKRKRSYLVAKRNRWY